MTTPTWASAQVGTSAQAGQINMFLGSHQAQYIYTGTNQGVGGAAPTATFTDMKSGGTPSLAAKIVAYPATTVSYAWVWLKATGNAADVTAQWWTNSGSTPGAQFGGSPSVTIPAEIVSSFGGTGGFWVAFPMPITGLTATTTYWLVLSSPGSSTNFVSWAVDSAVTGRATNPNSPPSGAWTTQTANFSCVVWGTDVAPFNLNFIWEDSGAGWVGLTWDAAGKNITTIAEFCGALRSVRSLTATSGEPGRFPTTLA